MKAYLTTYIKHLLPYQSSVIRIGCTHAVMITSLDAYVFAKTALLKNRTVIRKSATTTYGSSSASHSSTRPNCVCFLGDKSTGKTALVKRLSNSSKFETTIPTVGGETITIPCTTSKGNLLFMCVKDTSGDPNYASLLPTFYRGAEVGVLVFDLTDHDSFDNIPNWARSIRENESFHLHTLILCGTKLDLVLKDEELRQVTREEAKAQATWLGCIYLETSAKSGAKVMELRNAIIASMRKKSPERKTRSSSAVKQTAEPPPVTETITEEKGSGRCCCFLHFC